VGEFAASLAHEVRNPITAIKIDLQALEERTPDDPMLREPLERALHEIKRLDATVGDALAMVRMGNGDQVLDLRVPLAAAVRSASPRFAEGESTLDVLVSDQSLPVSGDAAALEQLFLNVLLNAAEALPAGGKAQVHAASGRETVEVVVEDNGPGISDEIHDRVFDPLFSTKSAGTGLGLTVSRRIVDAHRGELTITTGDDGGARVRICFPRYSDPARASTQSL
jgi:signal transduction histidine kinase